MPSRAAPILAAGLAGLACVACADAPAPAREQRILDALAEDNYVWGQREPALVAMKLRKMQRGPYEWLRGTALLYWRDMMEPGERPATAFGDPASSRVLLVADPHPENVGTYRAADGTMFVDWNDFDATGYGPYTGDLRRLGAGLVIVARLGAPGDEALAAELVRRAAGRYAQAIAELAAGTRIGALGFGASPLFDDELDKARTRGDARFALDELAPITGGVRQLALGDLEEVAEDGVLEDRVLAVDAEESDWLDRAIAQWRVGKLDEAAAAIKLRARRVGSGISSYPVYRFNVVLEGASPAPEDDVLLELKETREGLVIRGVPQLEVGEWPDPAVRSVDTQRRLHARPDGDALLGAARVGGLSLKIRDREAYQRGIDAPDLSELAGGSAAERDRLLELAALYGGLLARAHGQAETSDGRIGHAVIAPLLAGREAAFADEIVELALADADVIGRDYERMRERDLAALLGLPGAPL